MISRPVLLVLLSSTSFQFGTAVAASAFAEAGPLGAVWIRGVAGAVLMLLYVRPRFRRLTRVEWRAVVPYALAIVSLIFLNYLALSQAPLGIVSAILLLGPLTVSALGSRGWLDLSCVVLAGIGVTILALAQGVDGPVPVTGVLCALGGAVAFGAYVYTGKALGRAFAGFDGLAVALVLVAIIQTPFGLAFSLPGLWQPEVIGALILAGLLATVIPFGLEISAMRSLSAATFGLVLAFEPAIAALAGFVVLGQALVLAQVVGIAVVIVAGVGSLGPRGWTRRLGGYNRALMADPTVAALAAVPLFNGLTARDLAAVAAVAEERDVADGVTLTEQGSSGDEFFIVAAGAVDVSIDDRHVRTMGPGEFLGEIALVFGGARTATAVTTSPTRLYVLPKADFLALLARQPKLEDRILTSISERMRYR